MTTGEKLLSLTIEYQKVVETRQDWGQQFGTDGLTGREPAVIAAEYERTLKELLLVPGPVVTSP